MCPICKDSACDKQASCASTSVAKQNKKSSRALHTQMNLARHTKDRHCININVRYVSLVQGTNTNFDRRVLCEHSHADLQIILVNSEEKRELNMNYNTAVGTIVSRMGCAPVDSNTITHIKGEGQCVQ